MTERIELKRRKQALPESKKKVDTTVNGNARTLAEKHKEVEKRLLPLVIDHRTVIYVPPHKCNEQYAEEYRARMGMQYKGKLKINHTRLTRSVLHSLYCVQGMNIKAIGRKLDVSHTTVRNYLIKYGLKEKTVNQNENKD